jgi:hypothetical protein
MNRTELVEKLLKEGFSEKTLVKFTDKQLNTLSERVLGEQSTGTLKVAKGSPQEKAAMAQKQAFVAYEGEMKEEKPSAGLSKEKKSEIVKKAKKGEDLGKKGKGFEKIVDNAKKSGSKNPESVAAAAMWKNVKRESVEEKEMREWVDQLMETTYHSFTSKGEIMEMIQVKLNESETMTPMPVSKPTKGHNGVPEFMTHEGEQNEQQTAPSPSTRPTETPTKPGTKPEKPKRENPFEPKHTPKPKAKLPEFMKFDQIGIKLKESK